MNACSKIWGALLAVLAIFDILVYISD